jgi:HNH endonuclease
VKQLDRLLFEQGGECFFCRKALAKSEASIEHLVASANGGPNHEDNCVACCKTLNALLGSKALKQKFQVVLNQRGSFKCPAEALPIEAGESPAPSATSAVPRPPPPAARKPVAKPMFTLAVEKPTAKVVQPPKQAAAVTCPTCKSPVAVAVG